MDASILLGGLTDGQRLSLRCKAKPKTVNVHEAKTHFSKLLKRVRGGEEGIIAHAGLPVARIVPLAAKHPDRKPGNAKGLIRIADDFDAPIPEIEKAMNQPCEKLF